MVCLVSFRILVTFVAYCRILQSFAEYYRLLQNIIVEYKKIDYGKNDKRNGSAGLSHP